MTSLRGSAKWRRLTVLSGSDFLAPMTDSSGVVSVSPQPKSSTAARRLRLRSLIILPFLAQMLAVSGAIGYLSYRNGQRTVETLAEQLTEEISQRIDENLRAYLAPTQQIDRINAIWVKQQQLSLNDLTSWEPLLWEQVQTNPDINFIKITNPAGQQRTGEKLANGDLRINVIDTQTNYDFHSYKTDDQGNLKELDVSFPTPDTREGAWYKDAVMAGQPVWSSVFISFLEDTLLVASATPIYSPDNQELLAVLNSAIRLNSVGDFLNDLEIGETGQAFLIERREQGKGSLLATSTDEIPFRGSGDERELFPAIESQDSVTRAAVEELLQDNPDWGRLDQGSSVRKFQIEGRWYYLQAHPLQNEPSLDWLIGVVVPEADFTIQIRRNTQNTILLSLGAVALTTLAGLLIARWLSQPLEQLTHASQAIASGELQQDIQLSPLAAQEVSQLAVSFGIMSDQLQDSFATLEQRVVDRTQELNQANLSLQQEQAKAEELLLNILPGAIATQLKESPGTIAELFEEVTILFADIVGFTPLSNRMAPLELVEFLNSIFSSFDALADRHGLEKIKTIGDAYMVAAGLPKPRQDHAQAIADMALDMQAAIAHIRDDQGQPCQVRIGINTGIAVAGVIGTRKFIYDLWGDAVNVAARMESHGEPGHIQVTHQTYLHLKEQYQLAERGRIQIKGKGELQTYWLLGRAGCESPLTAPVVVHS